MIYGILIKNKLRFVYGIYLEEVMIVLDILNFLDNMAPVKTAKDFDNVGLLIGDEKNQVKNVYITLDLTRDILEKAKKEKIDLIITHHPIIFHPLKKVLKNDLVYDIVESDISVISMHTNLDIAERGVSYFLAKALNLLDIKILENTMEFARVGRLEKELDSKDFIKYVSKCLKGFVRGTITKRKIKNVAVVSGSGYFAIDTVISEDIDALVTGESKHDIFLKAKENDFCFVDASHFKTEHIFCEPICDILNKEFGFFGVNFFVPIQKAPFCVAFGDELWG